MINFLLADGRVLEPVDYEELPVADTAVPLTEAKVRQATCCYVRFEDAPMRYRVDVTPPTDTVGLPAFDGQEQVLWGPAIKNFKVIRSGSTSGMIRVVYCRLAVGWSECGR